MPVAIRKRRMARPRVELDEKSADFHVRFAIKLRGLMAKKGWASSDLAERISVSNHAVDFWLRAEALPRLENLEEIAEAFGLSDYRKLLPEPL
jgi:transcriptional regulator with XRE-family HTH domain